MAEKTSSDKSQNGHENKGEFRSGPIAGSSIISGATFQSKSVVWSDVDGWALLEGDILLGRADDLRSAIQSDGGPVLQSVGITGPQFRWPDAVVPFDIDSAMPNQQRVTDAIAHWEAKTTLRFRRKTASDSDFVLFNGGQGCSSQVGRQGGQQLLTLGASCSTGNAIHEIGHTIGFWHEQSREDRDNFIRIEWANIDPAMQHNFTQHIADGDDLGGYDFGSIMHYPVTAFSKNGQPTITPIQAIPPGVTLGQRNGLSEGDVAGALLLYPRPSVTFKEVRKDPVKEIRKEPLNDTIKEIQKEPIRDTIKEIQKEPIRDTIKEIQKEPIRDTIKEVNGDPTLAETVFQPGPNPQFGQQIPFTMARGSQFGGGSGDLAVDGGITQIQALAEAVLATEQQLAEINAAYESALAAQTNNASGGLI